MIKLRYLEISEQILVETFLHRDEEAVKDVMLERMHITRQQGESHADAWVRTMHKENGLTYTKPYHRAIVEAIQENLHAYRLFYALA